MRNTASPRSLHQSVRVFVDNTSSALTVCVGAQLCRKLNNHPIKAEDISWLWRLFSGRKFRNCENSRPRGNSTQHLNGTVHLGKNDIGLGD